MSALLKQARVVVVDDEAAVAWLFSQQLMDRYKVNWFSSAPEALEHLRRHPADLLVTDLVMPQINGLQLTGMVKDQQPEIKVVMVSGLNPWAWCQGQDPNLARLDAFLAKPVSLPDLEKCCGLVLKGRASKPNPGGICMRAALAY